VGLRLWKWGRTQWILWFAPKGEIIEDHCHLKLDARIRMIAGRMIWRAAPIAEAGWTAIKAKTICGLSPWFRIYRGQSHGGTALAASLFLVRETWIGTGPMTSAARDFHPTH
jgi:hypothetical protein